MNPQQLQEQIALYYSKLSPKAQEVFSSMRWMETLENIAIKYNLNNNQKEVLATETTLALLGIEHLDEYQDKLINEIDIPRESLEKMFMEINDKIFKSISDDLVDTFYKNTEAITEEKYGKAEELDKRFEKLPQSVQTAISESNYQEKLYTIANEHKLSIDKMSAFEEVTTKVLIGIIHPDQYESELASNTGLPKEDVTKIVTEVNEQILKSIRDILKKHWEENEGGVVNEEDEVPIPPYAISTTQDNKPTEVQKTQPESGSRPLSKVEEGIYGNAGIEIVEGIDMISSKLKGITISKSSVSDHSLPKVTPPIAPAPLPPSSPMPTTKAHDPYHETIE